MHRDGEGGSLGLSGGHLKMFSETSANQPTVTRCHHPKMQKKYTFHGVKTVVESYVVCPKCEHNLSLNLFI